MAQDVTYWRNHGRVRKVRGPASDHQCWRCLEDGREVQAEEWAQIHTEDGTDPWSDFIPLCHTCHQHYDRDRYRRGWHHTEETKAKMSATAKRRPGRRKTPEEIEKIKATLRADPNRREIARRAALARWGKR